MKINIIEFFEETLKKSPEKIAVIDGERSISFEELGRKAKCLASIIATKSETQNRPVGAYLPKSIEAVISNIATLYSGNIYMNLDVKSPTERIGNILSLVQPTVIITNSKFINVISNNPIPLFFFYTP